MENAAFLQCTRCGHAWASRDDFLRDPNISLIGYQVSFIELRAGFFLFNHNCFTTLSLRVDQLTDLYDGPIFKDHAERAEHCPEYCLHKRDLRPCPVRCECASVREIIQAIQKISNGSKALED